MNKAFVGLYILITLVIILGPGFQASPCGCDLRFRMRPFVLDAYIPNPMCLAMPCLEQLTVTPGMKVANFLLSPQLLALLSVILGFLLRRRTKIFFIWGLVNLFWAVILPIIIAILINHTV